MARSVMTPAGKAMREALEGLVGCDLNDVVRVVIDIGPDFGVIVHVERLANGRLPDVLRAVRTLDGVEIRTTPVANQTERE